MIVKVHARVVNTGVRSSCRTAMKGSDQDGAKYIYSKRERLEVVRTVRNIDLSVIVNDATIQIVLTCGGEIVMETIETTEQKKIAQQGHKFLT